MNWFFDHHLAEKIGFLIGFKKLKADQISKVIKVQGTPLDETPLQPQKELKE